MNTDYHFYNINRYIYLYQWITTQLVSTTPLTNCARNRRLTPGAQMDMVIERADKVVSLCEMKYTSKPYSITKQEADKLRHRAEELGNCFPTQKQVLISLVSNRIPKKNTYYNSLITSNIIINKLFDE